MIKHYDRSVMLLHVFTFLSITIEQNSRGHVQSKACRESQTSIDSNRAKLSKTIFILITKDVFQCLTTILTNDGNFKFHCS